MFLLRIKDDYMGGTPHRKTYTGRGDTAHSFFLVNNWGVEGRGDNAHTLLKRGTIGVGTAHNIERKSKSLN